MATAAYSAYGTQLRVGDGTPLAPLTVTTGTNASPIILTTSAPHGVVDVSYALVAGVVGLTAANGTWVVRRTGATTLALVNSVGNAAYVSGGTLTISSTFASIAELTNVQDAGSRTDLIDTSAHDGNGYSSQIPTLKRTNTMRLDINLVPGDPTHDEVDGLLSLFDSGESRDWLLVLPPYPVGGVKSAAHLYGFVAYYTMNLPVNGVVQAQISLEFDGALTWAN